MANLEDNIAPSITWYWGSNVDSILPPLQTQYPTAYIKNNNTRFWNGYGSEDTVIWRNFNGKYPFRLLMHLMDRYPLRVEVRGSSRVWTTKQIIIMSRNRPESYYPDPHGTLERRLREFTARIEMPDNGQR